MANRWNGFDPPRSRTGRVLIIGFVALSVVTVACSEGNRIIAIGGGEDDAGVTNTQFDTREDAGDASSNTSDASVRHVDMCVATECPYPFATCGTGTYTCATNLLADQNNCGACGNVCPSSNAFPEMHMETRCLDGACQRQCVSSGSSVFQDCNGLVDDGCETNIANNPDNCGACGNVCPPGSDGARRCLGGQCGCPPGQTWCDPLGCTDTSVDDTNCGACGNQCQGTDAGPPPPHMEYRCQQGLCAQLKCEKSWADCNGIIPTDGCEINIATDRNNCGACGNACPPDQKCLVRGDTVGCGCQPLETLCADVNGNEYCADLLNDTRNCGACGYRCQTGASCKKGFCEYECPPGRGDCDGDPRNGCETDLLVNPRHCGTCGNQCDTAAGQPCISGSCLMVECDAGGPIH
jgi:hypothetical protein